MAVPLIEVMTSPDASPAASRGVAWLDAGYDCPVLDRGGVAGTSDKGDNGERRRAAKTAAAVLALGASNGGDLNPHDRTGADLDRCARISGLDLASNRHRAVDWYSKTYVGGRLARTGTGLLCRVHPDHFAGRINEWATGVAGVDRRRRLEQPVQALGQARARVPYGDGAPGGGNDPVRYCLWT